MRRVLLLIVFLCIAAACSSGVQLSGGKYPALPDSVEVSVIDGEGMGRAALERVLSDYEIVSRFSAYAETEEQARQRAAQDQETWQLRARRAGGHAVLYTRQSDLVAAIMQNTRFAAPSGTVAIYILRRR